MNTNEMHRTCYIHIGPPKTGSSTISHFIEGNVDKLAALGVFVPMMPSLPGRPLNGHGTFAKVDELNTKGKVRVGATLWPELEAVAAEGKLDIILTSEYFAHAFRNPVTLDRILTFFERYGYAVTIIAYLRDQPSSLNSSYVQSQKRLVKRMTFEEFVDEAAETGKVDPWRYLEHIIDNPRLTLDMGCFETVIKTGFEKDFLTRIGVPPDADLQYTEVRNPNAGAKAVYAAQQILERIKVTAPKLANYKKVHRRFKKRFEERGWTEAPYVGLDQDLYARIRAYYSDANERFSKRFFGASWTELSPDRRYEKQEFDPTTATEAELAEIEEVVKEMVRMIKRTHKAERQGAAGTVAAEKAPAKDGPPRTPEEKKALRQLEKKRRIRAAKAARMTEREDGETKTFIRDLAGDDDEPFGKSPEPRSAKAGDAPPSDGSVASKKPRAKAAPPKSAAAVARKRSRSSTQ